MTNFDFLKSNPDFADFADVAISAENLLHIDVDACVLNCRRAMEFAVKWMYSVDDDLIIPCHENLQSLINAPEFKNLVGIDIWKRMDFIRRVGNNAAHVGRTVSTEQAEICLENLFVFFDCLAFFYSPEYKQRQFDRSLLELTVDEALSFVRDSNVNIEHIINENNTMKKALTARRAENQRIYIPHPLDMSEYKTRKVYIDSMIEDAGWTEGVDWLSNVELYCSKNENEICNADCLLFGDDGKPLALIESKCTCVDTAKGRRQAVLSADLLERKYGRRPIIFLSDGFDTRIWDDRRYTERKVASVYSKSDLEKLFYLYTTRTDLAKSVIDGDIAGRYYQVDAIKAVCKTFDENGRRKALVAMATGTGKTRTVIALCKVLFDHGWVNNVLFLADRSSLVVQAKREFIGRLPNISVTDLCSDDINFDSRCVFSDYQSMMDCIDTVKGSNGKKLFTVGYFDLVIVDEAHRSVYNKYKDLLNYFDAPLLGLTATPKDEIDKDTYENFDLADGIPTYSYGLSQAVADGFLVDFMFVESDLKFVEQGMFYDDLSNSDRLMYEDTFESENLKLSESISAVFDDWIFNDDTIRQVLHILMNDGLRIECGEKLGKSIIFAKNHEHAEKIHEIFLKEYPHLPDYTKIIDSHISNLQNAIDEFSDPRKLPQIAISVDMLDTGIDVPQVLNLVFFKRVMSKAKFRQMIGRGTRRCEGLIDGNDKDRFYIFDFCGNFEFFRMNNEKNTVDQVALQSELFKLKSKIVFRLQSDVFQTEELIDFRKTLVDDMALKVRELDKENFAVRQHLRYVEQYADPNGYRFLTYEDTLVMADEIAPLIMPCKDDVSAIGFDVFMYGMELAYLEGTNYSRDDLYEKVNALACSEDIPDRVKRSELIDKILYSDYLENAGIGEFECIRKEFRGLMKYTTTSAIELNRQEHKNANT